MLTHNQTALLVVLAQDEKLRIERGQEWVGRTMPSLVSAVSKVVGQSAAYAAFGSLIKVGFINEAYKGGRATGGVKHFVWISPDGLRALENEHVLLSEAVSTAEADGATMGSASDNG